jgi:2-polyprenyl-3-methyl-5-hydroxy-6-metoxy-1,4-benzoquinol methylase
MWIARLTNPEATGVPTSTYDPAFFARLFAVEDRHFWFRVRNLVIERLVRQVIARLPDGYRVLEVGCGTGNVLRMLDAVCTRGTVVGMDQEEEGIKYARTRTSCALIQGDVRTAAFDQSFDIVGLFDVLEHIPEDAQVLRDLRAVLTENGALLLTVPAHPSLWSYFDVASHHQRRYTAVQLRDKLEGADYRVEYMTHYMMTIFPAMWLGRRLAALWSSLRGSEERAYDLAADELRVVPIVNDLLFRLMSWETEAVSRRWSMPFGSSLLALARK